MSAAVWVVAGGLAMYGMALAVKAEMNDFPGGPDALARSIAPSSEAMRAFRWPAERLDTLGGYLTYHNVVLINLLLAVYGALQGVRAVRGDEDRHVIEEVLAAGVSRAGVVRDRAIGFAVVALVISLGLGLGTAAGLAGGGEPDLAGSLVTAGTSGLVTVVGFAFGLAVSQVTASARSAGGVSAAVLVALYVVTNLGEELGPFAVLRFVSPFHYANESRALVPGHGLDLVATGVLLAMVVILLGLGAAAFANRDYGAALWSTRRRTRSEPSPRSHVPTALLGSLWTASLRRGWLGLLAWSACAAALTAMYAALQPSVMDVWSGMDFIATLTGGGSGVSAETAYWTFAGDMVAPVIAAFVATQASGWVADLTQGRVEMVLVGPVSWSRLVVERCLALLVGVGAITAAALAALVAGAAAVGGDLEAAGIGRLAVGCLLFGAALGAVAAVVVAWVRRPVAVTVFAVFLGASYLLSYFVPLFGWPDWLNRLSMFWAFGHPYLDWPPTSALAVLVLLAGPGTVLAARVAERTPKVA